MQYRSRSRSSSTGSQRNNQPFLEPNKRLFISGLVSDNDENHIRSLFAESGNVTDFFFRRNEDGSVLCFVSMATLEQADTAIANLNGKKISNKMIWVKYAKPKQPREDKKEGFGGGKQQSYGRPKGDYNNKRDEGAKRYGNYNHQDRNEGASKEHRGRFNNFDQEGGNRNNRQNNFRNYEKRDYQPTKESSGFGKTEGSRAEQASSKKPCEDTDY